MKRTGDTMKKTKTKTITAEERQFIDAAKMLGFEPLSADYDYLPGRIPDEAYLHAMEFSSELADMMMEFSGEYTVRGLVQSVYAKGVEDGKATRSEEIRDAFKGIVGE